MAQKLLMHRDYALNGKIAEVNTLEDITYGYTIQSLVVSINPSEKVVHYNKRLGAVSASSGTAATSAPTTIVTQTTSEGMSAVDAIIHTFTLVLLLDFVFQPIVRTFNYCSFLAKMINKLYH